MLFYPKPLQKPHPPIWVGGESPGALRRAIKFGDAWYPGNNSQTKPLDTAPRLAAGIADVKRMCEAAKRDPASLGITLLVQDVFDWGPHKTQDGSARRMFTGSSADMAADAAALAALGVGHAALRLGGDTAGGLRGAHRAVRRRGDRQDAHLSRQSGERMSGRVHAGGGCRRWTGGALFLRALEAAAPGR